VAWLWNELQRFNDDVLVCDARQDGELSGEFKTDWNDACNWLGVYRLDC